MMARNWLYQVSVLACLTGMGMLTSCTSHDGADADAEGFISRIQAGALKSPLLLGDDRLSQARIKTNSPARASLASAAGTGSTTPITAPQLLDWAQLVLPSLFPPGAASQVYTAAGLTYNLRFYASTGNYLAIADGDGSVYGLGPFTNQVVMSFGKLSDYTCDVKPGCAWLTADADGNMSAGFAKATDLALHAGDVLMFQSLTSQDNVIELNSRAVTSAQLCADVDLPAGVAHPVVAQKPIPASHYAGNELSGPYRTYPAGIYPMAGGSDVCGLVEKTVPCAAPNEYTIGSQINAAGKVDYLCTVAPVLMSPADPTTPANNPPIVNPACVRGKVLDSTWADAGVQGVFLRFDWKDLNPTYGAYDWTTLDRELVAAVRNGKSVTVGIRVGGNSIPDWAFATGDIALGAVKKVQLKDWGTASDSLPNSNCGFDYTVASPSDEAFKSLFKKMIAEMGAHMRADQRRFSALAGVKITGMGMATLENRLPNRCNIAVKNSALGDTGTQGHIITMATTSLAAPIFDSKYSNAADPTASRIKDVSQCVCNPQVLQFAGYRPAVLQAFYSEIEATIRDNFGYKQQTFMNISNGFPQIGEVGRFLGDHLKPPISSSTVNGSGQTVFTYGTVFASPARSPGDIPDVNDTTSNVVADARAGVFAGGDLIAARNVGVENAALDVIGFSKNPNQGVRCSQQMGIDLTGAFAGSAAFPIAATTHIDATGPGCPNVIATLEGVAYNKVTGFQVTNALSGAIDFDEALWNATLNTNAVFFEPYESGSWSARKQSALNAGGVLNLNPSVKSESGTLNGSSATAKSAAAWNALLLARAKTFSADPNRNNLYQRDPYPSDYAVTLASAPATTRYFFNARACKAYTASGTPVRINAVTVLN